MDNTKITVNASKKYDVVIGSGIIDQVGAIIKGVLTAKTVAIITDDVVDALYASVVEDSLQREGFSTIKYVFANGEKSKNISTYGDILSWLASHEVTRTDAIVALGGGVVGDMAGFAAATYLRGIKYVQVPTTLLAQIDSSVGGKTAIDLNEGKNLVGAFCQPSVVVCDVDTLKTLPKSIYLDGMGEVLKYALIDGKIFDLLNKDSYAVKDLVTLCVDCKRRVVEEDEFEGGLRRILNLGHTVAHGIERLSHYTVSHGRAVSMGLKAIVLASSKHGYIDGDLTSRIVAMIEDTVGDASCQYTMDEIVDACLTDKKRSGDKMTLIVVHGVGDVREQKVDVALLKEYLA